MGELTYIVHACIIIWINMQCMYVHVHHTSKEVAVYIARKVYLLQPIAISNVGEPSNIHVVQVHVHVECTHVKLTYHRLASHLGQIYSMMQVCNTSWMQRYAGMEIMSILVFEQYVKHMSHSSIILRLYSQSHASYMYMVHIHGSHTCTCRIA